MLTVVDPTGILVISPENDMEAMALRQWQDSHLLFAVSPDSNCKPVWNFAGIKVDTGFIAEPVPPVGFRKVRKELKAIKTNLSLFNKLLYARINTKLVGG